MITFSERRDLELEQILPLYQAHNWSATHKPEALQQALLNSHALISAWDGDQLVGLGNAISDGFLVVYYPHLLVAPAYQGQGIGRQIMTRLQQRYAGLHMHMLVADEGAIAFYEKCGFTRAGQTQSMWIYDGDEH
ncbi:GNAT family N-acetyltransferase [Nodosilinea sp. LEGE 06152]|uniref:GNAT family N-acetyltransferase n=1 Tax=Nodosilinea sp. LEGE 06152 TaxID=2777966 RepID=UPI001882A70C|nr:GNAT family N-acetyltransferase [Nodosilinea sp. LEGE 06152]MBE9158312.1 GNAT family N-acetyltransferase [Nodosilinea sp. LEGE 06152]